MENQNEEKKSNRGGARAGAGRPKGRNNYRSIALRIPEDVAEILDKQVNRSAYIIEAIRAYAGATGINKRRSSGKSSFRR